MPKRKTDEPKRLKMEENVTIIEDQNMMTDFLKKLIDSKKLPVHIKTVDDAFTIAQMGKELGFATMQSFHYIIPIQGKLSLSAKATGALLRRGGIKFTTKEDGVFVYKGGELKPKTPEEQAKSNADKNKLNQDIEKMVQNEPKFDTLEVAKTKINNFVNG